MRSAALVALGLVLSLVGCVEVDPEEEAPCGGDLVRDDSGACVDPRVCPEGERELTAGGCAVPTDEECTSKACDEEDRFGDRCQEACFVWRRETATGAPPARAGACFVAVGEGEFLQFGGVIPKLVDPIDILKGFNLFPQGDAQLLRLDPGSGVASWQTLSVEPRPSARAFMTCVPLGDGRVLIAGGEVSPLEPSRDDAWIYEDGTFTRLAEVPQQLARSLAMATALPDGGALIAGGCRWNEGDAVLQDAWLFVDEPPRFVEVDTGGARLPTAGVLLANDGSLFSLGGLELGPTGSCGLVNEVASASVALPYAELHEVTLDRAPAPSLTLGATRDVLPALRVKGSISNGPLGPLLFGGYLLEPRSLDADGGTKHTYAKQTCLLQGEWTCRGPNNPRGGPREKQPDDRFGAGLAADSERYLLVGGMTHGGQALDGLWRFERCGADECPPVRPGG